VQGESPENREFDTLKQEKEKGTSCTYKETEGVSRASEKKGSKIESPLMTNKMSIGFWVIMEVTKSREKISLEILNKNGAEMSKKDESKCPSRVSCTIRNPEDYPGMCEKCIYTYGRPVPVDAIEDVARDSSGREDCYTPEVCKTCERGGYTRAWGDELMFLCMFREWPPEHWANLQKKGECGRYLRDTRIPKK